MTTQPQSDAWRNDIPMSTEMLKALAHPVRQQLVNLLRREKYVRAADAAAVLGEPANKVSFHLRVLADAGLIDEAPDQARDRRDRVWTARQGAWSLGDAEHPIPDEALGNTVMQLIVAEHNNMVRRVVDWAPEFTTGRDAAVHGTFARTSAHLTEPEFEALMARIHEVIAEAKANRDEAASDAHFYEIDIIAADELI